MAANDLVAPEVPAQTRLCVQVTREMWSEYFVLTQENGYTEELEVEETRAWFKERGGNMDLIEKALDQVWNFGRCMIVIDNPKAPAVSKLAHAPKI